MQLDPADGGYLSRKFIITFGSILLLCGVGILSSWFPAIATVYTSLCGTTATIVGLYLGANNLSRHITSKSIENSVQDDENKEESQK